jgi:drug/metabolite transporter (DMT)-like permease
VSGAARSGWIGPAFAIISVFGFSLKAIIVKLAYASHPVDPVTLLALRMIYAAPLFAVMAWWASRDPRARPFTRADWLALTGLGFVGYYLSSLVDFIGLQYVTASLERLVLFLYPTIVVLLSAIFFKQRITRRNVLALVVSYAGIVLVVAHDLRLTADTHALWLGGALVFASGFLYAVYLVGAGPVIARLGSLRFVAWAMLASTVFVLAQFAATRPMSALVVPAGVHGLSVAMAVFSTALPIFLMAEALQRIGANRASLIGSLGPVFTIALGYWLLGEPVHPIQLAGAALVLGGVMLMTVKPASPPVPSAPPADA